MKHEKSLHAYLQESEYINYSNIQIQDLIRSFKQDTEMERIKAVFEYVRDEIDHSYDVKNRK